MKERYTPTRCIYDNPHSGCREVFEDGFMVDSLAADQVGMVDRRGTGARLRWLGPWKPGQMVGDKRARYGDTEPTRPPVNGDLFGGQDSRPI